MNVPRPAVNGATTSVGLTTRLVTVQSISPDGKTAYCVDRANTQVAVPMLIQPSKASLPAVGDTWLLTQTLGSWTFTAFVGSSTGDFQRNTGAQGVHTGATAPDNPSNGELWVDSSNGNLLMVWNGITWQPLQLGAVAIQPGSITAEQIAIDAAIAASQVNFTVSDIGGVTTTLSATAPAKPSFNDLWYDAGNGYRLNQWSGTEWIPYQWGTGSIAARTITAELIAANTITASEIVAGIILAGVVNGTIITGATFVATGTSGEILCYSGTPTTGNLIMSFAAAAGTDSFGNSYIRGLSVGVATSSSPQVQLIPSAGGPGSPAVVQFTLSPQSFFNNQPNIQALSPSNMGILEINGPSLSQTGFRDWVQDVYNSWGGTTPAHRQTNYIDTNGNVIPYVDIGCFGTHFGACSQLSGVHPGTGTGNVNTAVQETWQSMSLINGWAGIGGINGIRYQMTPLLGGGMVYIEGDIINAGGAPANSICGVLAAGYRPPVSRNVNIIGWNNPQSSNSASAPWLFVDASGNVQITGLESGTKEVFFQAWIPMT